MTPTYIGIDKVIKTIGKLRLDRRDILIFRTDEEETTFEAIDQAREEIKKKTGWDGYIVVLKHSDDIFKLTEQKERDLFKALKHKYQEESNV